jgi:hypothetical protein
VTPTPQQQPYLTDRLAGLAFSTARRWCYFRADCGFEFNHPLDEMATYAALHPDTEEFVGFLTPHGFVGPTPTLFQVYLLRPLREQRLPQR